MAGSIFTGDVIKSQLEDANRNYYGQRTWAKLFGDLDLSKQLGTENLIRDYGAIMGEAYKASKANQSAILGSNIGQGYKNAMLEENQLTLDKAYDSYMSQYLTEQAQLNQSIETQRQSINKELDTLAQRTADYGNAHFDYLQALWDKHEAGELNFNPFKLAQFQKFLTPQYDADGNPVLDAEDNPIMTFKHMSEIQNGLFDEAGNITQEGIDFFDMLEHEQALNPYSFADYLSEADKELYEWSRSENPYNFAPNAVGLSINDATFRQMVGQSSLDEKYNFLEKAYGLEDGEIKNLFADLETKSAELIESLDTKGKLFMRDTYRLDEREINELSSEYVKGLNKIASDLGMSDELTQIAKDANYDNVEAYVNDVILKYVETVKKGREGSWLYDIDWSAVAGYGSVQSGADVSERQRKQIADYDRRIGLSKNAAYSALNDILSKLINRAQSKND